MKKIIDISTFDGTVDFEKMKKDGIVGVIIRAGYGASEIDEYFREHIKGANAAGLPAGIYWFSYAYTVEMARKEAKTCLDAVRPYKIDLPVFWDYEYASDNYAKTKGVIVNRSRLNAMAETFCDAVQADTKLTVDGLAGPATHQMILANLE